MKSTQTTLHVLIQSTLLAVGAGCFYIISDQFDRILISDATVRGEEIADGVINSMNMLMLNGDISNPGNRTLLIAKMKQSKGVADLRIVRAQQVSNQFGPGLPEENPVDALDGKVLKTGKKMITRIESTDGRFLVRIVIPYLVSTNFRGTNCLACHNVQLNSVNGAASVSIDMTSDAKQFEQFRHQLLIGWLFVQIALALIVSWLIKFVLSRHVEKPITELKHTISEIISDNDLSRRAITYNNHGEFGGLVTTFNNLLSDLQGVTEQLTLFSKVFKSSREAIIICDSENRIVAIILKTSVQPRQPL